MERVFKVVMIGGVGSGKTSLRNYLLYGNYTGKYTPTTNSDFVSTHITLSSQEMIAIQIWDTCESSSELLTTHSLLQDADGVMLVCDGANSASLQALERHLPAIDTISKSRRGGLPVMLVRTKSDMVGADAQRN
ncbi:activation of store-operated calcium channel activity protein [Coemansia sp. RSA 2322]|nr:activation of store-operated calcium channel activity protein [Coemansia sp. RSA 2322]